jgi:DNA repair exonuclease SbcCD nuclease subunit
MKRIVTGDLHLSGYQSDILVSESGLTQRLDNIIKTLDFITCYAHAYKINYIDIAGDLNNDKDLIYTDAQNAFKDLLIRNKDIHFTIISGNHDLSKTGEGQTSSVAAFEGYKNATVITKMKLDSDNGIVFLPYSNHLLNDFKKIKRNDENFPILLSHFGLNEAVLQSGLSMVSDVKLSDLTRFKLVLLGHYHKPQDIANDYTKLFYVGNPAHLSWNDKNEQKRFIVYDTETLQVESVSIKGFIEYREFAVETRQEFESIRDEVEKLKNLGNYVKIRKNFHDEIEEIDDPVGVMVIEKPKEVDITNRGIDLSQTDAEKMNKYQEIKEIPETEREEYIRVLHEEGVL